MMRTLFTRPLTVLASLLFLILLASAALAADSPRQVTSLNEGWRFHRGDFAFSSAQGTTVTAWRWRPSERGEAEAAEMSAPGLKTDGAPWQDAQSGQDVFRSLAGAAQQPRGRGGFGQGRGRTRFAWFRAVLPAGPAVYPVINFQSVDDNASVYLNGKLMGRHQDQAGNQSFVFALPLEAAWRADSPNELAVLVENNSGRGGIGTTTLTGLAGEGKPIPADSPIAPAFDDYSWRRLNVPHDYIVEGTVTRAAKEKHGFLPLEPAWYRRTLSIPASARGKRLWLEFDGVFRNSQAWINGRSIGGHVSGYTSFRFDVTDAVVCGRDNVLTMRVDPTSLEGWWYEGGGIYRHVRLVQAEPVHIAPEGVFVSASVPVPGDGIKANGATVIQTTLANETAGLAEVALLSEILDSSGTVVAQARASQKVASGAQALLAQNIPLDKATLWSIENPYLYTLRSTVLVDGKSVDQVSTRFGVRTIRFDPDHGFFLNGKRVEIKGTCNHQDHAGVGIAVPDRLMEWRIEKLKEMGSNAYRCAHNVVAPELLDICDRLGMLVMDENRKVGESEANLAEVVSMVKRDRNHPSIIIWSMLNEEGRYQGTAQGAAIFKVMQDTVRLYDTTRPVSCAMNGGWFNPGFTTVEDLIGFNYFPENYVRFHAQHPGMPIYGSETASEVLTRGIYTHEMGPDRYFGDRSKGYVSQYGVRTPGEMQLSEKTWRPIVENEFMAGCFVWTGFDYKGEPYPYGWPCINSHFGIMDICGFPKDSYYYYQAAWSGKPVLHIMPHWNWPGQEGQEIEVWVHNNCKKVELFLNGVSLGAQDSKPNQHLVWKVKYAPGKLEAKGLMADGKEITTAVETTGEPAGIALEPDRMQLAADGVDLSMVAVKIVDAQGRVVPVAANEVTFAVSGPGRLIGVGNGDPSSHEPDKADKRHAFGGLCQAIVQTDKTPGPITLTATSPGIKAASVTLQGK